MTFFFAITQGTLPWEPILSRLSKLADPTLISRANILKWISTLYIASPTGSLAAAIICLNYVKILASFRLVTLEFTRSECECSRRRLVSSLVRLRSLGGSAARHCVDVYSFFNAIRKERHCYAGRATRSALAHISSSFFKKNVGTRTGVRSTYD